MLKYFLYHEDNQENRDDRPQEDYFLAKNNIFIVADGITHDLVDGNYPNPSEAFLVAKMATEEIFNYLKSNFNNLGDIKKAFSIANQKIAKFQKDRELYRNRESNNYTFGATVIAVAIIKNNKLYYGVLDDCFISVFGKDGTDCLKLIPYVEKSTQYLFSKYSWDNLAGRKFWRKKIRNHQIKAGDESYGYGVLDGQGDYEPFLQTGEMKLKKGDFVCVYSDGFIKPFEDKEFIKMIEKMNGSTQDLKQIADYLRKKEINKEKSGYFIKFK